MDQQDQLTLEEQALNLFRKVEERYSSRIQGFLQKGIRDCGEHVHSAVRKLKNTPRYLGATMLASFTERSLQVSTEMKQLAEGLDEPFMLFVMGMGKYGKSTLLNALLEQKAAEVDIIPKTWKIDIFEGRGDKKAIVRFSDGTTMDMTIAQCKAYLQEEEAKRAASEKVVNERFRSQAPGLSTIQEKEELKRLLYDKLLYKSKVVEVRWPVKPNRLLNDFRLVDTPGLIQNLIGEVEVGIQEYYHKADGVIWLLDATVISSQKSRKLLDELNESFRHIGGRTDNIIAVLNSIDKVRKQGGEEAVQDVVREAKRLFGDLFQDIVPLSAKEACEGIEKGDKELIERSGIRALLAAIQSQFYAKARIIQTESKQIGLKNVCRLFNEELQQYRNRLRKDSELYEKREEEFDHAYDELIKKIEKGNAQFIEKYQRSVLSNIERYAERIFDYSDQGIQKSFIQSSIFESDSVTSELKQLQKKYEQMLEDFWKYHSSKAIFKEYTHLSSEQFTAALQKQSGVQVETAYLDMDTSGISLISGAGMFIAGAAVLGPLGLVLAGIASAFGMTKWIAVKMKLSGVKSDLHKAMYDFSQKLEEEILGAVNPQLEDVYEKIEDIRDNTYSLLHGDPFATDNILKTMEIISSSLTNPLPKLPVKELLKAGA